MLLQYDFKPIFVKRIYSIFHKGKKRGFRFAAQAHEKDFHEMMFVDYGRMELSLEKRKLIVNPGECIFIAGGTMHSFKGVEGAPFDFLNVMFSGKLPDYFVGKCIPVNRRCFELLSKLKQESDQEQIFAGEMIAACMTELIVTLARQTRLSVPGKMPEAANFKKYQSEYVNRALKVIADEYSRPLSMKMLCKSVGIGEGRLRQLFKVEVGKSFKMILHMQRIAAAKHLIAEGKYSIEDVAAAVGYGYPYFFFRVFKRLTGMTPGAYAISLGEPQSSE